MKFVSISMIALITFVAGCHNGSSIDDGENSLVLCTDGKDNNDNGLVDCEEQSCQGYSFCNGNTDGDAVADGDADGDADSDTNSNSDTDTATSTDSSEEEQPMEAEWVTIPAGDFWMGSPDGNCPVGYPGGVVCDVETSRNMDEELHHVILTQSFEIMTTEVTQWMFESRMKWDPSLAGPFDIEEPCGINCPAENVSWYDAIAYANALSNQEGITPCFVFADVICMDETPVGTNFMECINIEAGGISTASVSLNAVSSVYDCEGYRLPTESEWEYAARAGSNTPIYPSDANDGYLTFFEWEPLDPNLDQIAWYGGNSDNKLHSVAQKKPNEWGLYDILGNVKEWTWDWWYNAYSSEYEWTDPEGNEPAAGRKAPRGCTYSNEAKYCRIANRFESHPGDTDHRKGLRLVKTTQ